MHQILLAAIGAIAAVFFGMTAIIVVNKGVREARQFRHRERRRLLEPTVLAYARGGEVSLRAMLGSRLQSRDGPVLEALLLDHAQRVKGSARERLTRALDELGYVDRYLAGLTGRRWWQRAAAAENLGLSGATRAVDALVRVMEDEVTEVRMRAAKALGLLGGSASIRPLIRALAEPNRWSSIRIADVLAGMGRDVTDELVQAFPGLGLPGKLAILDVVGRIRPLHLAAWLVERLGDSEPDVRARACHALGAIGDPNGAGVLEMALADEAWPVRAMAARALGRVGGARAITALCGALSDPEWWVRANAARALRDAGASGQAALVGMLDHVDRFARDQAVLMLEEIGEVDRQARGLVGGNGHRRGEAEAFIRRLIAAGQTERLRALSDEGGSPELRRVLRPLLDSPAPGEPS